MVVSFPVDAELSNSHSMLPEKCKLFFKLVKSNKYKLKYWKLFPHTLVSIFWLTAVQNILHYVIGIWKKNIHQHFCKASFREGAEIAQWSYTDSDSREVLGSSQLQGQKYFKQAHVLTSSAQISSKLANISVKGIWPLNVKFCWL